MNARSVAMALCRIPAYAVAAFLAALLVVTVFDLENAMPRVLMLVGFCVPLFLIAEIALLLAFATVRENGERRTRGRAWWGIIVPVAVLGLLASTCKPHRPHQFDRTQVLAALQHFNEVV